MAKTAMVRARIEPDLKLDVEKIFKEIGLNAAEAITVFYKNVQLYRGIPFEIRVPNATTRKAIADARKKKVNTRFSDISLLRKELEQ